MELQLGQAGWARFGECLEEQYKHSWIGHKARG